MLLLNNQRRYYHLLECSLHFIDLFQWMLATFEEKWNFNSFLLEAGHTSLWGLIHSILGIPEDLSHWILVETFWIILRGKVKLCSFLVKSIVRRLARCLLEDWCYNNLVNSFLSWWTSQSPLIDRVKTSFSSLSSRNRGENVASDKTWHITVFTKNVQKYIWS